MTISRNDMRVGRKVTFRGNSTLEGNINVGMINGTTYAMPDDSFYVPVYVQKLSNGKSDECMMVHSSNIVEVRDCDG